MMLSVRSSMLSGGVNGKLSFDGQSNLIDKNIILQNLFCEMNESTTLSKCFCQ